MAFIMTGVAPHALITSDVHGMCQCKFIVVVTMSSCWIQLAGTDLGEKIMTGVAPHALITADVHGVAKIIVGKTVK